MSTQLFNNDWVRRFLLALSLYGWLLILDMSASTYNAMPFCLLFSAYLLWVACKCWMRWIIDGRTHLSFWLWYGSLLVISAVITASNFINGLFITFIAAFICDRSTADMGGNEIHLRGGKIITLKQANAYYKKIRPKDDEGFPVGAVQLPTSEAKEHIAVAGTIGSGKTITIKYLMVYFLRGIGRDGTRALINDPKTEFYPYVEGLGIAPENIVVMNPFDNRGVPWAVAIDIDDETGAETLARLLIPKNKNETDSFWHNATVLVIKVVVLYLIGRAPGEWRLRDVVLALRSRSIILKMMENPELDYYKQAFGTEKTADNIMATLLTSIAPLQVIAALWHKQETVYNRKPYSLTEWANKDSKVILLGSSSTAATQIEAVNSIIVSRSAQLLLDKPETFKAESFLILDELASLGDMTSLVALAEKGRSKGVSITVGFQSKKRIDSNFGEDQSTAFLGYFNHIIALRLKEEATAKWIAGIVGNRHGIRFTKNVSTSWGKEDSYTENEEYFTEPVVEPSELTEIPPIRPEIGQGLTGLYLGHVNWWATYDASIVNDLPQPTASPTIDKMPKKFQKLEVWDAADYQRLNMQHFTSQVQVEMKTLAIYLNGSV